MTLKKALVRPLSIVAVVATALILAGCPSGPPRRGGPPSVDRAEQLKSAGDYAGAATVYEKLAGETTGSDSAEFLLRAARTWFTAGRPADADRVLALLPPTLTQQQAVEQKLLRIQSAVAQGRGDQAWRDVSSMQTPTATASAARYYETRQQVAIATGHLVDGIRSELARERLITPGEVTQARNELLGQLRAAADRGTSLAPPPGSDATVRGWLEAAGVAADNLRNPTLGATRLASFRSRFPSHPALAALANEPGIGGQPEQPSQLANAPHVALMLPLSGRTAAASAQIRDGFMTAYYELPANGRPRLRVYDTGATSIAENVAMAVDAGAEFIVGPLTREEVVAAAELISKRPPILALNFLPPDKPAPDRYYQFALSPEDDARAVARYIGATGKSRGVVLTPEGDWGTRVAAAFSEELKNAGGFVLGQASFNAAERDYRGSIMNVLRTDDSTARQSRIQATIGQKLEFEPRRRPDIQFIFAPSQPGAARLLRPQLRFHLAGDLPEYTLGDAYDPHPTANQEIDGVMFPDMPWMVDTDGLAATVRDNASSFSDPPARRGRLFAFGYDAFRIATSLQRGQPVNPQGLTGTLSIDPQGRVRRELEWVRIKGGAPVPMEPASDALPSPNPN
ncbi:MAG TPA: penicillin-binding protein activator [Steroidobacteraceae bacterium]|nr:penicillin-binding protein activator [Steroidobacteraceae bacterium]